MTYKKSQDLIHGLKSHFGNCGVEVFALNIERTEGTKSLKLMEREQFVNDLTLMEWTPAWPILKWMEWNLSMT